MPKSTGFHAVRALLGLTLVGLSFEACSSSETATPACGPGTTLSNGQCVVAAECGPGTVLKAGKCVPENTGGNAGGSGHGGSAGSMGGTAAGGQGTSGAGSSSAGSSQGGMNGGTGGVSNAGTAGDAGAAGNAGTAGSTGTAGNAGASAGASLGGQAGQAGSAGANQAGQGGAEPGGNAGQAGAAGEGPAGTGGSGGAVAGAAGVAGVGGAAGAEDVDDPCPDTPITFNCDPACGEIHPGCAIGCTNFSDPTPNFLIEANFTKNILFRTPSNPGADAVCVKICDGVSIPPIRTFTFKINKIYSNEKFFVFANAINGWGAGRDGIFQCMFPGLSGEPISDQCVFQHGVFPKPFPTSTYLFVDALKPNARARNITLDLSATTISEVPPGCTPHYLSPSPKREKKCTKNCFPPLVPCCWHRWPWHVHRT